MSLLAGSSGQVKVELNLGSSTAKSCVCVCVCVCLFEVLTAAPDEYILNTSKISENEAAVPLIIMIIIIL